MKSQQSPALGWRETTGRWQVRRTSEVPANERLLLLLSALRPHTQICAPVRTKSDTHTDTLTHRTHRPTKRRKRMTGRSVTASVNWIRAATHTPPNLLRMALRRGVVSSPIGPFQVTPISGRPISERTLRPPVFSFSSCWPLGDDSRILSYESRSLDIISRGPSAVRFVSINFELICISIKSQLNDLFDEIRLTLDSDDTERSSCIKVNS